MVLMILWYCVCLFHVAISVSFNESTYVFEHKGPMQPMLVLDKPSPCCLKVPVEVMSGTATGKLCMFAR